MSNDLILDKTYTEQLRMLDEGIVNELVDLFSDSVPKQIAEIEAALQGNDFATLRKKAHSLKSSAGNLGGVKLAALCKEIEHHPSDDGFAPLVSNLTPYFLELKDLLLLEKTPQ